MGDKHHGVDPGIIEKYGHIAKERADWVVDAVAAATQNHAFLRGDPGEDSWATEAIFLNSEKAILISIQRVVKSMKDEQ